MIELNENRISLLQQQIIFRRIKSGPFFPYTNVIESNQRCSVLFLMLTALLAWNKLLLTIKGMKRRKFIVIAKNAFEY